MRWTAWATLAVLGVYFWTGVMAGWARGKYKVPAPSMDGPLPFQSAQRVQANTLEQLPLVLAPLWLCATYLGDTWAAAGGLLWCVGPHPVRARLLPRSGQARSRLRHRHAGRAARWSRAASVGSIAR